MKKRLGIDLGAQTVRVCVRQGVLLQEPSAVAVDRVEGKVLAVCSEAVSLSLRTPGNADLIWPARENFAANAVALGEMIAYCLQKVAMRHPHLVIAVPQGLTGQEERILVAAAKEAGAKSVNLVRKSVAAAIGAGLEINSPQYSMVVDIGDGSGEIAVIGQTGAKCFNEENAGGYTMNRGIAAVLHERFECRCSERIVEDLKINAGSLKKNDASRLPQTVSGYRVSDGLPIRITVTPDLVRVGMAHAFSKLCGALDEVYQKLPGSAKDDIRIRGIILTGGGSRCAGLEEALQHKFDIPVRTADRACDATVTGLSRILAEPDRYTGEGLYLLDRESAEQEEIVY